MQSGGADQSSPMVARVKSEGDDPTLTELHDEESAICNSNLVDPSSVGELLSHSLRRTGLVPGGVWTARTIRNTVRCRPGWRRGLV